MNFERPFPDLDYDEYLSALNDYHQSLEHSPPRAEAEQMWWAQHCQDQEPYLNYDPFPLDPETLQQFQTLQQRGTKSFSHLPAPNDPHVLKTPSSLKVNPPPSSASSPGPSGTRRYRHRRILLLFLLLLLILGVFFFFLYENSFSHDSGYTYYSRGISDGRRASAAGSDFPELPDVPATAEITDSLSLTVYWTPGGGSYHFSKNCTSLKRSKTIRSGTLQEALDEGKTDPCNLCANGS